MSMASEIISQQEWLMNRACRYFKTVEDQKDLVAECIYRMLRYADRYDPALGFRPWAATVMHNIYVQIYKHRQCIPIFRAEETHDHPYNEVASDRVEIREILSIVRHKARVTHNIECVMLYAKGYSCFEISNLLGVPVATVRTRIHYGRKAIKDAIKRQCQ